MGWSVVEITGFLLKHLYELMADDYTSSPAGQAEEEQARRWLLIQQSLSQNDLPPANPIANPNTQIQHQLSANRSQPSHDNHQHYRPTGKQRPSYSSRLTEQLSRRLDRLEFELRRWLHLARPNGPPAELPINRWPGLSSRLELAERFIAITTTKMYEMERRLKELEKCECRLSCKWRPANFSTNHNNQSVLIKADGATWESNCDVCSCKRGRVTCSHVDCPPVACEEPHQLPGKCCPVCFRGCKFAGQSVKHGNKLVINSGPDSCKQCTCYDGRLRCQRAETDVRLLSGGPSRPQRSIEAPPRSLALNGQLHSTQESLLFNRDNDNDNDHDHVGLDIDLGLDVDVEDNKQLADQYQGQGNLRQSNNNNRRHSRSLPAKALVCPQVECGPESQIRLRDHCCVYCRGHDFCEGARNSGWPCHPNATCHLKQDPAATPLGLSLVKLGALFDAYEASKKDNNNNTSIISSSKVGQDEQLLPAYEDMLTCKCRNGFEGDGRRVCRDIDECSPTKANKPCDPRTSRCINLAGSYRCQCRPGFRPPPGEEANYTSCLDVDECSQIELSRCHHDAVCTNLPGSHRCQCKQGFLGNGIECHPWLAPGLAAPAAYLHRASSVSNGSTSTSMEPLVSLDGDDDDDRDDANSDSNNDELALTNRLTRHRDSDEPDEPEPSVPNLADFRWDRLRLDNSQQPADNEGPPNTRTMFFQAPSRFRATKMNVTRASEGSSSISAPTDNRTSQQAVRQSGSPMMTTAPPAPSPLQSDTIHAGANQTPSVELSTTKAQFPHQSPTSGPAVGLSQPSPTELAQRRGTIITSAVSSPFRNTISRPYAGSSSQASSRSADLQRQRASSRMSPLHSASTSATNKTYAGSMAIATLLYLLFQGLATTIFIPANDRFGQFIA